MDQLVAIRAFVRVVEAGTFIQAARAMSVGAPTVTRLVQDLERHLQVRLLHRSTRSMTLTPEGETYYGRVARLLDELADLDISAKHAAKGLCGRLHVECPTAIATQALVPALPDFHRAYPELRVHLRLGSGEGDLVSEGIDCAVRVGDIDQQCLVARRIGELRLVTCATPRFLADQGVPQTPADLLARRAICMHSTRTGQPEPFRFEGNDGPLEIEPAHSLVVNDMHAYLAAGLAGLGMIQAPAFAVRDALSEGRLVALLSEWQPASTPVYIAYAQNRFLAQKVRVFIDWLVGAFQRHADLGQGRSDPALPTRARSNDRTVAAPDKAFQA